MFAYVGCRTTRERHARGKGISVFRFEPESASLQLVQCVEGLVNPSFLALNRTGDRLYSVHGDTTRISAFAVDDTDGTLTAINTQDTQGKNPVHLALDPAERHVVVSNHIGGTLAVLPIREDGGLDPVSQRIGLPGRPGPHRIEQPHAKPHFNPFAPGGRHVVVPDKGLDRIFVLPFIGGRLDEAGMTSVQTREGSGPRHLAFGPNGDVAYCVNELDSSVTTYRWDAAAGSLTPLQWLPALPASYTGNSRASAIQVDPAGRFVYASNRGYDSIAVFAVDSATGLLAPRGHHPAGGRTPRHVMLSPDGRFMLALNEDSDSIVVFEVNPDTGRLGPPVHSEVSESPVCLVFSAQGAA